MAKTSHRKHQEKYFTKEFSDMVEYDKSLTAWRQSYLARIRNDLLGSKYKSKTLVDVGTGSGYVAIEMAKLGLNVIATDIVKLPLKRIDVYKNKNKLNNIKTILSSTEVMPLKDKCADYIVINSVLEHVEDEESAIREWRRLLKPGGKIFITVPLKYKNMWPFLWPISWVYDRRMGHLRRYDLHSLQKKLGLKVMKAYYTGHPIKVLWFLITRPLLGGLTKSSSHDYLIEKLDKKFEKLSYGGSNLIAIFSN